MRNFKWYEVTTGYEYNRHAQTGDLVVTPSDITHAESYWLAKALAEQHGEGAFPICNQPVPEEIGVEPDYRLERDANGHLRLWQLIKEMKP